MLDKISDILLEHPKRTAILVTSLIFSLFQYGAITLMASKIWDVSLIPVGAKGELITEWGAIFLALYIINCAFVMIADKGLSAKYETPIDKANRILEDASNKEAEMKALRNSIVISNKRNQLLLDNIERAQTMLGEQGYIWTTDQFGTLIEIRKDPFADADD